MVTRAPAAASAIGQMAAGGGGARRIDYAGNLLRLAGDMDAVTHAGPVAALVMLLAGVRTHTRASDGCLIAAVCGKTGRCECAGCGGMIRFSRIRIRR